MSRLLAYLQLFRLPNVFTAAADVLMGYLVTQPSLERWQVVAPLVAASCLLYTAGMVLNDAFDVDIDARERPERPIPSGRISLRTAKLLGYELLVLGVACGWIAGANDGDGQYRTPLVALALAATVWLYDRVLKRTPIGPLGMGACRFLNVLLGMSTAAEWLPAHWLIAAGIGIYVVGVTWFARTEAEESNRGHLVAATAVMAAGIGLLAWLPAWELDALRGDKPAAFALGSSWYVMWLLLSASIGHRCVRAILSPSPVRVQMAVRHAIISLIVLDAAVTFGVRGLPSAITIVLLLIPTVFLGRWVYST